MLFIYFNLLLGYFILVFGHNLTVEPAYIPVFGLSMLRASLACPLRSTFGSGGVSQPALPGPYVVFSTLSFAFDLVF